MSTDSSQGSAVPPSPAPTPIPAPPAPTATKSAGKPAVKPTVASVAVKVDALAAMIAALKAEAEKKPKPEPEPADGKKPPAKPAVAKIPAWVLLVSAIVIATILAIMAFLWFGHKTESTKPVPMSSTEELKDLKAKLKKAKEDDAARREISATKAELAKFGVVSEEKPSEEEPTASVGQPAPSEPAPSAPVPQDPTPAASAPAPSEQAQEAAPTPDQPPTTDRMPGMPGTASSGAPSSWNWLWGWNWNWSQNPTTPPSMDTEVERLKAELDTAEAEVKRLEAERIQAEKEKAEMNGKLLYMQDAKNRPWQWREVNPQTVRNFFQKWDTIIAKLDTLDRGIEFAKKMRDDYDRALKQTKAKSEAP